MISVFLVHHLQSLLLAIFGRPGIYLPTSNLLTFLLLVLIPQRWLTTDSAISRNVLELYLEIACTNLIWAHFRGVRMLFIKTFLLPFPAKVHSTLQKRKIRFEEIDSLSVPCCYHIVYRSLKTCPFCALIFL